MGFRRARLPWICPDARLAAGSEIRRVQAVGLIWSYRAEIGGLSPRYLSVRVHVLQDHLFLLQRLEAADSDIPGRRVQHTVDGVGTISRSRPG